MIKYYILYDSTTTVNRVPEVTYNPGVSIPVIRGFYVYTHDTSCSIGNSCIELHMPRGGDLVFTNKEKAEIRFLTLKIKELKDSAYDYYFPKRFNTYVARFEMLSEKYPEYVI